METSERVVARRPWLRTGIVSYAGTRRPNGSRYSEEEFETLLHFGWDRSDRVASARSLLWTAFVAAAIGIFVGLMLGLTAGSGVG